VDLSNYGDSEGELDHDKENRGVDVTHDKEGYRSDVNLIKKDALSMALEHELGHGGTNGRSSLACRTYCMTPGRITPKQKDFKSKHLSRLPRRARQAGSEDTLGSLLSDSSVGEKSTIANSEDERFAANII
jgi:hypothetical protein